MEDSMTEEKTLERRAENYEAVQINFKNFQSYVEKYGIERAQGYFDALKDMANNIEGLFYQYGQGEYYSSNSPQRVYTRTKNFREESFHLVNQIDSAQILEKKIDPDSIRP